MVALYLHAAPSASQAPYVTIVSDMPRNTTSRMFFYVYVLESLKDSKRYIGYTANLKRRIEEHEQSKSFPMKFRKPFQLIYFEGCLHSEDAKRREGYLKTTQGHRFLGLRLSEHKRAKAFGTGS
jgi:putative endonuclease